MTVHPILRSRNFLSGVLLLSLGAGGLAFGQGLRMGTAAQMGPGYVPLVLSGVLAAGGL
jgi:hypothetical protein